MSELTVTFHGVRGSLAVAGPETAEVGGNTACVEVESATTRIILDAGTGLRAVGERLASVPTGATTILLSHIHWDHIQGLPFFSPIYRPGHRITIISGANGHMPLDEALAYQMKPPFFPVPFAAVAERITVREVDYALPLTIGDINVTMARLDHPDPVYGFRLECNGTVVVYATDAEICDGRIDLGLRRLAAGADVLICDAQYTPAEYRGDDGIAKAGWGHSTYVAATELARRAGVDKLVLFHHDPERSDRAVAEMEGSARALFSNTVAAREGMRIRAHASRQLTGKDAA
jgi:phosphoribosyl 1,2-cyclic phosphodiesterase